MFIQSKSLQEAIAALWNLYFQFCLIPSNLCGNPCFTSTIYFFEFSETRK